MVILDGLLQEDDENWVLEALPLVDVVDVVVVVVVVVALHLRSILR